MASSDLFEREAELKVLGAAIDRLAEGTGGAVAVEGPPGIGKTALLEGAVASLSDAGVEMIQARCGEFEMDFPFGVARQLFERRVIDGNAKARARLLEGAASHAAPALGLQDEDGAEDASAPSGDLPFTVIHGKKLNGKWELILFSTEGTGTGDLECFKIEATYKKTQ
jgi:AAA ATPase domain